MTASRGEGSDGHSPICPACGTPVIGSYCAECGAALAEPLCPRCGSACDPGDAFCRQCARPLGRKRGRIGVTSAVGVVATVLLALLVGRFSRPAPAGPPQLHADVPQVERVFRMLAPFPPRVRADRLFNLAMTAYREADHASLLLYAAPAAETYRGLVEREPGVQYHLGILAAITGATDEALAWADSLQRDVPNHLLATMLREFVAQMAADTTAVYAAYRDFLTNYDSELGTFRREYVERRPALEAFRERARVNLADSGGTENR